ncbi:hypothetical protein DM01DRAFT_1403195 [Hesseltinella vesiculosa]|uniref:Yeast cell wall synthesis Kre9/Knh1-like N-terminal domain-containing protein n=1 Tax=Hesseltinella vesiculosa TaxID=101127 RepID=A0A1X2GYM0_9FUNG|nr:hypothetical protein DM01DRAFT_1403195 [Hesseltinella vesiculosa]
MKFATVTALFAAAVSSVLAQNYTNGGVSITSPGLGNVWTAGTTQMISYTVNDPSVTTLQGIVLYGGDQSNLTPYLVIDTNVPANGSYTWNIPKNVQTLPAYSIVLKTSQANPSYSPYFTIMGVSTGGINATSININNLPTQTGASSGASASSSSSTGKPSSAATSVKAGAVAVAGVFVSAALLLT